MSKKLALFCSLFLVVMLSATGWAASSKAISITGAVKQPIDLSMEDLYKFAPVRVRLNEVTQKNNFRGAFYYRGVPLSALLELAEVQKKGADFSKAIDLAILIRNKEGKQTVLSWGEVFYRNPSEIIIAVSAEPILPHKSCQTCHQPEVYQPRLDQLKRRIKFPKLVVANDFYTDRSLEDISSIQIFDLHPKIQVKKTQELYSPAFTLTGVVKQRMTITELSLYPHKEILVKQMGDGKGYHGLRKFSGVPLADLLNKTGIEPDLNSVLLVSAADGYRSLLSYGELLLSSYGQNILIADGAGEQPLRENGRFILVPADDLSADRWVKAVEKIEVISLKPDP
jgi:DMSO/TMAO reductase YedYZ molybdopterin-dependent catalytic subunit